ncbi:MAG: nucleotidyl transferase AbiEii/AbiGii toxin family protein [Proteobacteria bacterium]|nr:nucleotidyl transferase AbiEii/AbiGii toxin family protein [Pseudomonadota bacterium]
MDLFVPDPQYLGYVSPRLNDTAEALTSKYMETAISVKLFFAEGEIDFIVSAPLTQKPFVTETVLGRRVRVETTAEILAKKVWHRGSEFTACDIFDFALIATRESGAIDSIRPILRERAKIIRTRIAAGEKALRTAFSGLDTLEFKPGYEECVRIVEDVLGNR